MTDRRMIGAIAGGLVAGIGLTAMMMLQEKMTGKPSELTELERSSAATLGQPTPHSEQLPSATEQAVTQGGHLALSALAGAAYAATTDDDADVVVSGVAFGLAFYAVAHWITGPALGVKPPEWRSDAQTIGMHTMNHVLFGLITAAAARAASRAGGEPPIATKHQTLTRKRP